MENSTSNKIVYSPQRLITFFGWPGVGKTTLSEKIADRISACIINKDSIAMPMTQDVEGELYKTIVGPGSYKAMWNIARDNLERGQSVMVESPFHNLMRGERDKGIDAIVAETLSVPKLICCVAPNDLIRERIIQRGEPRDAPKLADWETYVAKTHRYAVSVEHLKIDTSNPLEQNVEEVLSYLAL